MRQSTLFTRTSKEAPRDEVSLNAQLLIRAGYVDKLMAGVYTFLPLGLRVMRKIEHLIRSEMNALEAQEISMPSLQPKQNWETTGRWESYDSLFRFTSFYTETEYALGPTHEEIVSPLMKRFVSSYKQLPTAVYQIQTKFRDEKRSKSGLLRGREFVMKDLYSFHPDENDLDVYYDRVAGAYRRIFEQAGLGDMTYFTFASGGSFAKYSHEFQTLTEAGEDIINICDACKIAINKEIIEDQPNCPQCGTADLRQEKAVEVGNIFKLKTKYSEPFELKFQDQAGEEHETIMGCYGIGLGRLLGTVVEIHHDDRGIIWPKSIAPFLVHIVGLSSGDEAIAAQIQTTCLELMSTLQAKGVEVLYDDREGLSAGEKLKDSDLLGIPWRMVVSEKTLAQNKVELKARSMPEAELLPRDECLEKIYYDQTT